MYIRKINDTNQTNFKRLFMPSKKALKSYGVDFASKSEKMRSELKEIALDYDIYVIPRVKDQDKELFNKMWGKAGMSPDATKEIMPKGSYYNIYVAPWLPRIMKSLDARVSLGEHIYGALGVNPEDASRSIKRILSQKEQKTVLDEATAFYRTLS